MPQQNIPHNKITVQTVSNTEGGQKVFCFLPVQSVDAKLMIFQLFAVKLFAIVNSFVCLILIHFTRQ